MASVRDVVVFIGGDSEYGLDNDQRSSAIEDGLYVLLRGTAWVELERSSTLFGVRRDGVVGSTTTVRVSLISAEFEEQ